MRKFFVALFALLFSFSAFAQTTTPKKKFDLSRRAADHLMLQVSYDKWLGSADSVDSRIKGFSRGFNAYFMYDLAFKTNPRFSAAIGLGVSNSNIYFKRTIVDIAAGTSYLPVINADSLDRFKKFKVATTYLELPVELRFTANPENPGKTIKAAIGMKIGTLVNVHTKGKTLQDKNGNTLSSFTQKIAAKSYFNGTKLAATARIGYGYFGLFASYNLTTIFKDNVAPDTRLLQVGVTITGL